jgi:hypothetical protein
MVPPIATQEHRAHRDDLIGAGNEGLMLALGRCDPRRGFKFATPARCSILDQVAKMRGELFRVVHHPKEIQDEIVAVQKDPYRKSKRKFDGHLVDEIWDLALDFIYDGGRGLHELFSNDDALPGGTKKRPLPLHASVAQWTLPDKKRLRIIRIFLDALSAQPTDHDAKLFIAEWRDSYKYGFQHLCRSRRPTRCYRRINLWHPVKYEGQQWPRLICDWIIIGRPDIQAFLLLDGRINAEAARRAWYAPYHLRALTYKLVAEDGMEGHAASDESGYSQDFTNYVDALFGGTHQVGGRVIKRSALYAFEWKNGRWQPKAGGPYDKSTVLPLAA